MSDSITSLSFLKRSRPTPKLSGAMSNGKCILEEGEYTYSFDPYAVLISNDGHGIQFKMGADNIVISKSEASDFNGPYGCGSQIFTPNIFPDTGARQITPPVNAAAPELYKENLITLNEVLSNLDSIAGLPGVFDVEIRVKVDDVASWAVIGYGESGDPCILRFERA